MGDETIQAHEVETLDSDLIQKSKTFSEVCVFGSHANLQICKEDI